MIICVARKPATVEAERTGRSSQAEALSGATEQSHNGTRPKRYLSLTIASHYAAPDMICLFQGVILSLVFISGQLQFPNT